MASKKPAKPSLKPARTRRMSAAEADAYTSCCTTTTPPKPMPPQQTLTPPRTRGYPVR